MILTCERKHDINIEKKKGHGGPVERKQIISIIAFIIIFVQLFIIEVLSQDAGSRASYTRSGWVGAKYVAMGKAAEIIADDVYSIYWNPAGLSELRRRESLTPEEIKGKAKSGDLDSISEEDLVTFSEDESGKSFLQIGFSAAFLDIEREAGFCGVAFNMFSGIVGIGLYSIQSRGIESRNEIGNLTGKTKYSGSVGYISYGWVVGVSSIGFSFKGLNEKIGNIGYYGGGVDVGYQVELIPLLRLGFVIQDIGTGLKPVKDYSYIRGEYDFASPVLKLSAAITSRTSDFVIAFSGVKKLDQEDYEFNFGFQYDIIKYLSLYLGLNDSLFSSGIDLRLFQMDITYAFIYDRISGYNNIVSITLRL